MRIKSLLVTILGVGVAAGAVYFAQENLQEERVVVTPTQGPEMVEVLVARADVPYGDPIEASHITTQAWPKNAVPDGVYLDRSDVLPQSDGEPRRARARLFAGELLLEAKLSEFGEKVTLVQKLGPNMRAVAIRVDAVTAVGGFVTPGDRVDLVLTRGGGSDLRTVTILQNVKIIGVDQVSAEDQDSPTVARTVTVEVTPEDSQKIALAQSAGKLSLTLRTLDAVVDEPMAMIRLKDILSEEGPVETPDLKSIVTVRRGADVQEVELN
ncbi:MAG: Flp pilus assembly protein CpaB [Dinoroseobacter sp.]|nr:Flp pilus assembly protein CpaB [Dinoroseobacter sp.]